ncbi:hypothetical protein [Parapedobacter tibetensis]|uniref:hypothetical protein n=1 Tax=Parapedobacter tibetensis TaxID=2972951 RepID=UPI00214DB35B|nr:hypothetical protein [Parapedobacter tibetensis]
MKYSAIYAIVIALLLSCQKNGRESYDYWSEQAYQTFLEMQQLSQSVPCTDIDAFETVMAANFYFLVHPSIQHAFGKLSDRYQSNSSKALEAAIREGIIVEPPEHNPPLRRVCDNEVATLVFAQQLTLEEINAELPIRHDKIINFYHDVPCTDADAWFSQFLKTGCCYEGIAAHKTIDTKIFFDQLTIYNQLMERKLYLENTPCEYETCKRFAKPPQCVDGQPVVELVDE